MELKNVLSFLNDLKKNNNREWFHANKPVYQAALSDFSDFIASLLVKMGSFDKDVASLTPKECIFRIYRDVRFSKDKSPYKTNFGAAIMKGGKKSMNAAYYIHIEPGNVFSGGGIWMPPGNVLKAVRNEVYYNSDELIGILENKKFKETFGEMNGEKLQRPPVGFPKDFPHIELLKFKSYVVGNTMDDSKVTSKDFVDVVAGNFGTMHPFIQFLNRAVKNM